MGEEYVPKWKYDEAMKLGREQEKEFNGVRDVSITIDGMRYKVI